MLTIYSIGSEHNIFFFFKTVQYFEYGLEMALLKPAL